MTESARWASPEIEGFLHASRIPLRLACNRASGHPLLASLWFLPDGDQLWCATQRSARVVSLLEKDPRCSFEVSVESPPYVGVRGSATASLHESRGEEVLRALIDRYLGGKDSDLARSLLARVEREIAIALTPQRVLSWDYGERMRGIG